jgi:UDP-N-acetylglucosamine 2-epimerase (non-hydrolysing)
MPVLRQRPDSARPEERRPLLAICGTRPEAVKLAPVIGALRALGLPTLLVSTGQHPDLVPVMLREVGLTPDLDLAAGRPGATPAQLLAAFLTYLAPVLEAYRPPMVIVQGDTVSTLAGALAAAYAGTAVAHVEAGLRTGNLGEPFPEELHRQLVARATALHLAPTEAAAAALRREGIDPTTIHVTGNSGIDSLRLTLERLQRDPGLRATIEARFPFVLAARRPLLLATVHRRENVGSRLGAITAALARLAAFCEAEILIPVHPNPDVQGTIVKRLSGLEGIHLLPPLDHASIVWLMQHCRLLLTDSGGLQEEAPSLGLRTLVLRAATERLEAIQAGVSELAELEADSIVAAVRRLLRAEPPVPVHPFGDGHAATRIAEAIAGWLRPDGAAVGLRSVG